MKIAAPWMAASATRDVMAALASAGHVALYVGGCVRNTILGAPTGDIDIATDGHPGAVMSALEEAGIKAIGTGIDHGTVTAVARGLPHEITTFRRDVETDGRRATVAFSTRIDEDAARRDFTMNALYADADGTVLDPTGQGLSDLAARRLRFIGRAADRIAEDRLRILRYFRFHAWYADPEAGFDPDDLAAIADAQDRLADLSRERVGHEMRRLLAAPDPAPALATMARVGVLARVVPGAETHALAPLIADEARLGIAPSWPRRLVALGGDDVDEALRLSRAEARALALLREGLDGTDGPATLGYRIGAEAARDVLVLRGGAKPADVSEAEFAAAAEFPIRATDLMPALSGPALGERLAELEARWIASGFNLSRDDLLR
ncbi:MAG: CCA tRNA nucleotidyltransferase [Pseudomonadota bacterium]